MSEQASEGAHAATRAGGAAVRGKVRQCVRVRNMAALSATGVQLELAIAIAGGAADLASLLRVDPKSLSNWRHTQVPWKYRVQVAAVASRWPAFVQRESHKVRMAAALCGGKLRLAAELGVHASAISRWVGAARMPSCADRRAKIEALIATRLAALGVAALPKGFSSVSQLVDALERVA